MFRFFRAAHNSHVSEMFCRSNFFRSSIFRSSIGAMMAVLTTILIAILIAGLQVKKGYANNHALPQASLKQMLAQKLLIDLRYYCEGEHAVKEGAFCQQALTSLPLSLSRMLANTQVGGVILFAENLVSGDQILTLNHALQQAVAKQSKVYDEAHHEVTRLITR